MLHFSTIIYWLPIIRVVKVLTMNSIVFVDMCDVFFNIAEVYEESTLNGYEEVYKQAGNLVQDSQQILGITNYLRQKIIISHHESGLDYEKYTPVLDVINEVVRRRGESEGEGIIPLSTDWEGVISLIIKNKKHLFQFSGVGKYRFEDKFHNFAVSYIRLRSLGVNFIERDFEFYISKDSHESISNEIDRICNACGGEGLLNTLGELFGRTYNPTLGRFMEYRQASLGGGGIKPAIPFGYILAVASKYAGVHGNGGSELFSRLSILILDIIVVYEIQPYSQMEAIYLKSSELIKFVRNNLLYDNFVGIPQVNPGHAVSLIKHIQLEFNNPRYSSCDIKVKDLTRVALALISYSSNKKFHDVNTNELSKKAKIPEYRVIMVLDRVLSFLSSDVNAGLRFPPSSTDINHFFKPVIKISGKYKVYPKNIASLGCLNSVCNFISFPNGKWMNKIDSELGYSIENFLRNAFVNKGIKIEYGDRVNGDFKLEVDLLCETDGYIYIFEMKKKGLTRQAQSGNETSILKDLANSVLASHYQAMNIESVLNNCDFLHLKHGDVKSSISLNGRRVIRISVSLHDFGALQDKVVLQRLLTIAVQSEFRSQDDAEDEKLKEWREYSEKLTTLALENNEFNNGRIPFHNSLFMSIPQILMLLDKSSNADEFFKYLRLFITTTTGSRDVYTDFLNHINLSGKLKAEGGSVG